MVTRGGTPEGTLPLSFPLARATTVNNTIIVPGMRTAANTPLLKIPNTKG